MFTDIESLAIEIVDLLRRKKFDEARRTSEKGLSFFSIHPEAFYLHGSVLEQCGYLDEAGESYKEAYLRDPLNMMFLEKAVKVFLKKDENYGKALALLEGLSFLFVFPPTDSLLKTMIEHGIDSKISGSVGVHFGCIAGWAIMGKNEEVAFLVEQGKVNLKCYVSRRELGIKGLQLVSFYGNVRGADSAIVAVRGRYGIDLCGSPFVFSKPESCLRDSETSGSFDVSIIIPISGLEDPYVFEACIKSVVNSLTDNSSINVSVIVMCDGAEAVELWENTRTALKLSADDINVIYNPFRMGYLATVNEGIKVSSGSDMVVLNSDTIVHGNWIERLRESAYSNSIIGTVTPFGSWSEITSVPYPPVKRKISYEEVAELDNLCIERASEEAVSIPCGVGFCMYIKREVIDQIGGFNGALISNGYGEEVEFCLRAASAGWMSVACPRVFVGHQGGGSFSAMQKRMLAAQNNRVIDALYPWFREVYLDALRADPLKAQRKLIFAEEKV